MKFDFVVGNPPFQATKDDGTRKAASVNLWTKFWVKALTITRDTGVTALITPLGWMTPGADVRGEWRYRDRTRLWDVFGMYTSYAEVNTVAAHFVGVGSTFGYVVVNKAGNDGLSFSDGASTTLGFMPMSGHDTVIQNLAFDENIGTSFDMDNKNRPQLRVSIPSTRVLNPDIIEILDGPTAPTGGSDETGLYVYVYAPTQEYAEQIRDRVIQSIDILQKHCRYSGFLNSTILGLLSFPQVGERRKFDIYSELFF